VDFNLPEGHCLSSSVHRIIFTLILWFFFKSMNHSRMCCRKIVRHSCAIWKGLRVRSTNCKEYAKLSFCDKYVCYDGSLENAELSLRGIFWKHLGLTAHRHWLTVEMTHNVVTIKDLIKFT